MAENARTEEYEHIELFDSPALFTNSRIDRPSVPEGWYCYDVRGSDYDPGRPATLENRVVVNHAGTILSPKAIPFDEGEDYRDIHDEINFLGESLTLDEFCEVYGLSALTPPNQYELRPAHSDEAGLFYAQTPELDAEMGCIGHVRIDFGQSGSKFWHSWFPRGPEEMNSPEFKAELNKVVDALRKSVLKDFDSMKNYCGEHGGEIDGGWVQNFGYVVETERYRYCLRCNPVPGDYQAYLTCFDKQVQEMNQSQESEQGMTMGGM